MVLPVPACPARYLRGHLFRRQDQACAALAYQLRRHAVYHRRFFRFGNGAAAALFDFSERVRSVVAHAGQQHRRQPFASGPDHRPPQLMQTRPSRLVAAPSKHMLQAQRADPVLLTRDPPHGPKPDRQRSPRILKNCSSRDRDLMAAAGALPASGSQRPSPAHPTAGTTKPTWPTERKQILTAGLLAAEPTLQLRLCARIILDPHTQKHYRLWVPESNG
jgi:hypothetical protein